jgi:hypothetical protein
MRKLPVATPKRQRRVRSRDAMGPDASETDLVHALIVRAGKEFPNVRFFRRNTGKIRVGVRMFSASIRGQADIYAVAIGGRLFEIECKKFGTLSKPQKAWKAWCDSWGIPHVVLTAKRGMGPKQTIDEWMVRLSSFLFWA